MQQFEIAFSGQIAPGAELSQVKAAIARLFKADEALLARLFSGQRMIIKQSVDAAAAVKYQSAFQRAGAVLEVRDLSAPIIEEIVPGLPAEEPAAEPQQGAEATTAMLQVTPRDEYMAAFKDVQAPDFGIAALGDDLQPQPVAAAAPDLDLSALSLAPAGSDLGQLAGAEAIAVPDITHLKLLDND